MKIKKTKTLLECLILFVLIASSIFCQMPSFLQNNEKSFDKLSEDDNIDQSTKKEESKIPSIIDMLSEIEISNNFSKSVSKCKISPSSTNELKPKMTRDHKWKYRMDKRDSYSHLFSISETKFGLVSESTIRVYSYPQKNSKSENINLIGTITFKDKVILDVSADKMRNIYILFSVENKIVKYYFDEQNPSKFLKVRSLYENDFKPAAFSCTNQLIYMSSKENSQIRLYDHSFNSVDYDAVGLFENDGETCHFYSNLNCIEDIDVQTENNTTSSIYVVDSCEKNVKQFVYSKNQKIVLKKVFSILEGVPVSSIKSEQNTLIVLTRKPSQLIIFNMN